MGTLVAKCTINSRISIKAPAVPLNWPAAGPLTSRGQQTNELIKLNVTRLALPRCRTMNGSGADSTHRNVVMVTAARREASRNPISSLNQPGVKQKNQL